MLFAAAFAVIVLSQVGSTSAQTAPNKIGWIETAAFGGDEKGANGITKYVNALNALDAEMKPRVTELEALRTKIQGVSDEIKKLTGNPAVPVNQTTVATKQDEGQRLQREYEFKQKEAQAAYNKRRGEVLGPISDNIMQALSEYAKKNGYTAVVDVSALTATDAPSPFVFLDPTADITKAFITYYNARPATTATTTTPRQ